MAWKNKSELAAENAVLKREVELLRNYTQEKKEEIAELKQQLRYTQEALIAKESPEAYRDQKYAEELAKLEDIPKEEKERQKIENKAITEYIGRLEEPTFRDADDMIQLLTRANIPVADSLHGNDES